MGTLQERSAGNHHCLTTIINVQHTGDKQDLLKRVKQIFKAFGLEDELTAQYNGSPLTVWDVLEEAGAFAVTFGNSEHGTEIDIEAGRRIHFEQW